MTTHQPHDDREERLFQGVMWMNAQGLGLAIGCLLALGVFLATNWLVLKGGDNVGPHLRLLSQYFIGYKVTFLGSFIGAAYGFAVGTLGGALLGWVYNVIVRLRHRNSFGGTGQSQGPRSTGE